MIKAVLFDVDGVILDSVETNYQFNKHVMNKFFNQELIKEEYLKHIHLSFLHFYELHFQELSESLIKELEKEVILKYKDYLHLTKINENLRELLAYLKSKFKLGIVTSRRRTSFIEDFDLDGFFTEVITLNDVKNPKPHPEPVLLACKNLGIEPAETIFIGDTSADAESARAAGAVSVLYKNDDAKADFHIKDLMEVIEIVEKLNNNS